MGKVLVVENVIDNLKIAIDNRALTSEVLSLLLPEGRPFDCEGQLWDYKAKGPVAFADASDAQRQEYRIAIAELVKDAVAFHNAYGGYIVFGVADKGRNRLVGFDGAFNCGELNAAVQRYAGTSIECLYHTLSLTNGGNPTIRFGLLLIPRRSAGAPPVKMLRKGPDKPGGKPVFGIEVYVRVREPSFSEISDRLVEALTIIPSLIIIDDLDSLSPDEQRETVAALNSVALRTVGRDLPPSRVLMTSRIDQGLPPTAIVKIRGLERDALETHLGNLCTVFGIPRYTGHELEEVFEASSGSPLFAASIARLIKLGEDRREVVEKWKGVD